VEIRLAKAWAYPGLGGNVFLFFAMIPLTAGVEFDFDIVVWELVLAKKILLQ